MEGASAVEDTGVGAQVEVATGSLTVPERVSEKRINFEQIGL